MADEVLIYSSATCGWAVRNYAALYEKGVPFKVLDTKNSADARAEFLRDFPYALTPGLRHGQTLVWESLLINEYIETAFPNPPLLPATHRARARARQWLHHCDAELFPALYKALRAPDQVPELQRKLDQLAGPSLFVGAPSPFWNGAQIGLVDLAYHVLFKSLRVAGLETIVLPEWMKAWSETIAAAPSVVRAEAF
ncbi:MAG TPA: glutathione S-transferase family protein, partial [Verrucomicrobiae bacterium]|nr:glutathione S-transferase family protein [Verrucomicrobiae bacterium]